MIKLKIADMKPLDCFDLWQMLFVALKLTGHLNCSWWWALAILGIEFVTRLRPVESSAKKP